MEARAAAPTFFPSRRIRVRLYNVTYEEIHAKMNKTKFKTCRTINVWKRDKEREESTCINVMEIDTQTRRCMTHLRENMWGIVPTASRGSRFGDAQVGDPQAIDVSQCQRSRSNLREKKEGELERSVRQRHLRDDTTRSPPHHRLDSMLVAEIKLLFRKVSNLDTRRS